MAQKPTDARRNMLNIECQLTFAALSICVWWVVGRIPTYVKIEYHKDLWS